MRILRQKVPSKVGHEETHLHSYWWVVCVRNELRCALFISFFNRAESYPQFAFPSPTKEKLLSIYVRAQTNKKINKYVIAIRDRLRKIIGLTMAFSSNYPPYAAPPRGHRAAKDCIRPFSKKISFHFSNKSLPSSFISIVCYFYLLKSFHLDTLFRVAGKSFSI